MRIIEIDASGWTTPIDLVDALQPAHCRKVHVETAPGSGLGPV
jgi:hypothetical protein